jgi:predicted Zn-dependent protease
VTSEGLAKDAVEAALAGGATDADAALSEHEGVEVRVRNGEVEHVEESRSRSLGVRAFRGGRMGVSYTNDVSESGVRRAARRAADLASVAAEDEAAGLPDASDVGAFEGALDVVDPSAGSFGVEHWIAAARAAESAATSHAGVAMSEGARAGGGGFRSAFATSRGFAARREQTYSDVMVSVVASGYAG